MARAQGRRERRPRHVQARADAVRPLHGGGGRAGLSRHRRAPRAGSAAGAVEAARRPRQLHPALRHRGAVGLLRGRDAGGRRAQRRAASLREGRARRRRARHAPRSGRKARRKRHVFEWQKGSLFTIPLNACHRFVNAASRAGAAAVRHLGAERHEPVRQPDFIFNCPYAFHRALLRRRRLLQAARRRRAGSDPRPRHAAHQSHPRHRQLRAAARQSPLARLPARRAAHGAATASICGSASTRPAAIPRRTSTPPPPC